MLEFIQKKINLKLLNNLKFRIDKFINALSFKKEITSDV